MLLSVLGGLALVAFQANPPGELTPRFSAHGTEPFWSIEIADGRLRFEGPDRPAIVENVRPATTVSGSVQRYDSARVTMLVIDAPCNNGMSDETFRNIVIAVVDGDVLANGCGGGSLGSAEDTVSGLDQTDWHIVAIDGVPVAGKGYFFRFGDDRLTGRAGCNAFSADYRHAGRDLNVGMVIATQMGCPPPAAEHEMRVFAVLRDALRIETSGPGRLLLQSGTGSISLERAEASTSRQR